MLASHVIGHVVDHVTVGIFVVVYSWVDPINTLCSSAHHVCQHPECGAGDKCVRLALWTG